MFKLNIKLIVLLIIFLCLSGFYYIYGLVLEYKASYLIVIVFLLIILMYICIKILDLNNKLYYVVMYIFSFSGTVYIKTANQILRGVMFQLFFFLISLIVLRFKDNIKILITSGVLSLFSLILVFWGNLGVPSSFSLIFIFSCMLFLGSITDDYNNAAIIWKFLVFILLVSVLSFYSFIFIFLIGMSNSYNSVF